MQESEQILEAMRGSILRAAKAASPAVARNFSSTSVASVSATRPSRDPSAPPHGVGLLALQSHDPRYAPSLQRAAGCQGSDLPGVQAAEKVPVFVRGVRTPFLMSGTDYEDYMAYDLQVC